jgi:hypothetical protein
MPLVGMTIRADETKRVIDGEIALRQNIFPENIAARVARKP